MKYTKQNKASIKFLKHFLNEHTYSIPAAIQHNYEYIRIWNGDFKKLYQSLKNVLKLLDAVREEGYVYRIGNEEFRKQEERTLFKKSRLHKDFGKQSFEDLCKLFENDDCDFEYYKRIYADDIDQLIKENYDHIPRID